MRTRLRHFDRRLEARIGAMTCFPSPTQGPRKVRKPSKASKIRLGQGEQGFDRIQIPFGRMELDSGEPRSNSGEWLQNSNETSSKRLESPNVPPFGRMRYHSGESWSHSAEWRPQTARFLFFANRTPRAFRAFYPFCSLAYKYPSFL